MSEFEKVKALHDYLIVNVEYDYDNYLNGTIPRNSYTYYGALKNGTAVCAGYTDAFYKLACLAGLDVRKISGTAYSFEKWGNHAWNQVKVDGI